MINLFDDHTRLKIAILCCAFVCGLSTATLAVAPFTFL